MADNRPRYDNKYKPNYNRSWQNHRTKKHSCNIKIGDTGFLCTCDGKVKEQDCVRDCYNILNEHANSLFGEEFAAKKETEAKEDAEDLDQQLGSELESLKKEAAAPKNQRRFQNVESGVKGLVFIRTTVPDPVQLVHKLVSSVAETKTQLSKNLLRLIPVELVCKGTMEDICASSDILINKYFAVGEKKFSIVYSHTHNDKLNRDELIGNLATKIVAANSTNSVDLTMPNLSLSVHVIKAICCLSVVPDYFALKKYNLLELSTDPVDKEAGGVKDAAGVSNEKIESGGDEGEEEDGEKEEVTVEKAENVSQEAGDGGGAAVDDIKGD